MNIKKGFYKHFKGGIYEVLGTAYHSETLEEMVLYKHDSPTLGKDTLFVRPLKMFQEVVEKDGKTVPRFKFLNPKE